jgi:hypothetical protein
VITYLLRRLYIQKVYLDPLVPEFSNKKELKRDQFSRMAAMPGGILPAEPPPLVGGLPPPGGVVGGPEFLLLPEPEGGVLNHGGPDAVLLEGAGNMPEADKAKVLKVSLAFLRTTVLRVSADRFVCLFYRASYLKCRLS